MSKRKRISIFIPSFERGGVEKNALLLTQVLTDQYNEIDIVYRRFNQDGPYKELSSKINKINLGQTDRSIPFIHPRILDLILIFLPYLEYLFNHRSSLIIISVQSSFLPIILGKILGIPVITRISNHPSLVKYEESIVQKASNFFKKYIYRLSTSVVTNSRETADFFEKLIHKKVHCIYNPINIKNVLFKSQEELPPEFKKFFTEKTIVTVGRLVKQKDHLTQLKSIAEVVKKYSDIRLVIVGSGELNQALLKIIKELNLQEHVLLTGHQSNPYPFIKRAKLFILSSLYEGLPSVLIEATSLGVPVISSNCKSGPKEILLNGEGGELFPIGDYRSLADKIIRHFENPQIGQEKLEKVKMQSSQYTFETVKESYLNVISQISSPQMEGV